MNSHLKSVGKIFPFALVLVLCGVGATLGCVMNPTKDTLSRSSDSNSDETKQELSLKKDNEDIAELRKNIPAEKRAENEDLREILTTLGEVKRPPSEHREKFERQMRTIREKQRVARQKQRDAFNKEERRSREAFLTEMKLARDRFGRSKADKDDKKEFYDAQEMKRRTYFDDERDKRRDFESDVRQKENDTTAFYREKSEEFYRELKIYTTKYNEVQKAARERERARVTPPANLPSSTRGGGNAGANTPAGANIDPKADPQLKYLDPNAPPPEADK